MSAATAKKKLLAELKEVFDNWTIEDIRECMQDWFSAAMTHEYSWKHGSPGNLLYLHDQILKLFETSHELLRIIRVFYPQLLKRQMSLKAFLLLAREQKYLSSMPGFLTWDELTFPYKTLNEYVGVDAIAEQRKNVHLLLEMGLSNQTLIDEYDEHPENIIPLFLKMMKQIEAVHIVHLMEGKTKNE